MTLVIHSSSRCRMEPTLPYKSRIKSRSTLTIARRLSKPWNTKQASPLQSQNKNTSLKSKKHQFQPKREPKNSVRQDWVMPIQIVSSNHISTIFLSHRKTHESTWCSMRVVSSQQPTTTISRGLCHPHGRDLCRLKTNLSAKMQATARSDTNCTSATVATLIRNTQWLLLIRWVLRRVSRGLI